MPSRTLPLFLLCLAVIPLQAGLQFTETEQTLKATPQDRQLTARYRFKNPGPDPIWIIQTDSSCACTTATTDKNVYAPGEEGILTAVYSIGLSQGVHHYTITVRTADADTAPTTLKLTADVPARATPNEPTSSTVPISPRELTWSRQPFTTKTISIDLDRLPGATLSATCDSDQFRFELDAAALPATLRVTPVEGSIASRAEITLRVTPASGETLALKIPLTVLTLRTSR